MKERVIIEHPFFNDYANAYQSFLGKELDLEDYKQLKEGICGLFRPELLNVKWPAWEIGLPRPENIAPSESLKVWNAHAMILLKDFFKRAEKGLLYCDYSVVLEKFQGGVESRIGKTEGLHFNFEATYWTFNIKFNKWLNRNIDIYNCSLVCNLDEVLSRFDAYLREAFFPTPGPYDIGTKKRKKRQKQLLDKFAPNIRKELIKEIWG